MKTSQQVQDVAAPCPFCGGHSTLEMMDNFAHMTQSEKDPTKFYGVPTIIIYDPIDDAYVYYAIICSSRRGGCGAGGGFAKTPETALTKWNARAGAPHRVRIKK